MISINTPVTLKRAILAIQAARWAKAFVPLIRNQTDTEAQAALWGALCVYYARPFTNCRGLGAICQEDIPEGHRDTHEKLMQHRHKSTAHSDSDLVHDDVYVNSVFIRSDSECIVVEDRHLAPTEDFLIKTEGLLKDFETKLNTAIHECLNNGPASNHPFPPGLYRLEAEPGGCDDQSWNFCRVTDDGLDR